MRVLGFVLLCMLFACGPIEIIYEDEIESGPVLTDLVVYYDSDLDRILAVNSNGRNEKVWAENTGSVSKISLSYDKQHLAFLDEEGDLTILNSEGNQLDFIDEQYPIKDIEWAPVGKTLVYLHVHDFFTWGDDYTIPPTSITPSQAHPESFSISIDNDFAIYYSQYPYSNFQVYFSVIRVTLADGTEYFLHDPYNERSIKYSNTTNKCLSTYSEVEEESNVYNLMDTGSPNEVDEYRGEYMFEFVIGEDWDEFVGCANIYGNGSILDGTNLIYFGPKGYNVITNYNDREEEIIFDWKI